jgi:release factor glutamine methyltransferase
MPESIHHLLNQTALKLSTSTETALLDAEILLAYCLGKNRSYLRAWPEREITSDQLQRFDDMIKQRQQGMPIAYLTGEREFWSRSFSITPNVLIPRPDSELLIDLSLARLNSKYPSRILDLGTGSGILAVTLASERPYSEILATDICTKALEVAQLNALKYNCTNLRFLQSNWFDALNEPAFNLIISNPPYIAMDDPHLFEGDLRFEPDKALVSGEKGLKDIRLIAEQATTHLKNDGLLLIEHGYGQQNEVQSIFKTLNYQDVTTYLDLSGLPRVTSGLWKFL